MNQNKNFSDVVDSLAKAVVHLIYRNGSIENIHADITKNVDDADMKMLNKEIHNRLYTLMLLQLRSADNPEYEKAWQDTMYGSWAWNYGSDWDHAKLDLEIVPKKYHKLLKQLEKDAKNFKDKE